MSKFDFSPEALDKGLTVEEIEEFDIKINDFREAVNKVDFSRVEADQLRELHNQWISVGTEIFHVATKAIAGRAVKEVPPSVRKSLGQTLLAQITSVFDRFRGGGT